MPTKLYKILLIFGIVLILVAIPFFWLSYPKVENAINQGRTPEELEVNFFDVGQGDSILIKTPFSQNVLIDGGPDIGVIEELSKNLPWWDRTIDLIILSHPHDDHVNGLNDVIKRYEVKKILYTGVVHDSPGFLNWLELIKEYNIPLVIIDRPQTITLGSDCKLDIIYPQESLLGKEVDNLNNSSIVVKLTYKETSFLFTGDAEIEVEEELIKKEIDLKADVLKAGHHGSDTSSSEEFLNKVNPDYTIITVGVDNTFGHPSRRIIKRLERVEANILRTDEKGTIKMVSDGEVIKIKLN